MAILKNPYTLKWDWDHALYERGFPPPFPRGISHADADNLTEIAGNLLLVEGKLSHETLWKEGQIKTSKALANGDTALICFGDPAKRTLSHLEHYRHFGKTEADWNEYFHFTRSWANWADAHPKPHSKIFSITIQELKAGKPIQNPTGPPPVNWDARLSDLLEHRNELDLRIHEARLNASKITPQQVAELLELLSYTASDPDAFCVRMKVSSIGEIRSGDFRLALTAIESKAAKLRLPLRRQAALV